MKFKLLLCLALLIAGLFFPSWLSGCGTSKVEKIYSTPASVGLITHQLKRVGLIEISRKKYFTEAELESYLITFYQAWCNTFGDEKNIALETITNMVLVWEPDAWLLKNVIVFDREGNMTKGEVWVQGLTHSSRLIFVSVQDGRLENTSLAHELVHAILFAQYGNGDPDHEGSKFPGWTKKHSALIDIVNMEHSIKK